MTLLEYYVLYFGLLFAAVGVGVYLTHLSARRLERLDREARDRHPAE